MASEIATILTPELSLCAPVGMTQAERQAWLMAAAQKLQGMLVTAEVLRDALATIAVDHPAKIIPAIRAYLGDWNNPLVSTEPIPVRTKPAAVIEAPAKPFTLAEIRAMQPFVRTMGLNKGWITQEQLNQIGDA